MLLSFCIPTYNRREYLEQNLNSIVKQIEADSINKIEICVSDNCSNDGTIDMLEEFKRKFKNINLRYYVNDKNIGPDLNYLQAVKIAKGKFCWFMGSDDMLNEGALKKILNIIQTSDHAVLLSNRYECDINMKPFKYVNWFKGNTKTEFFFRNDQVLVEYLNASKDIACLFSYLSSLVFKKSLWDSIVFDNSYIGTAYSHAWILLSVIKKNKCSLIIINSPLILSRSDNDSFAIHGSNKRIKLDFDGYYKIARDLYSDNLEVFNSLLSVINRFHNFFRLLKIKSNSKINEWKDLYSVLKRNVYPDFYLFILNTFPMKILKLIVPLFPLIKRVKKMYQKRVDLIHN